MNLNKLTEKAQEAIVVSQNLATEQNHSEVTPEHVLVALVEQSGGIVPSVLRKIALDPARVATEARTLLKSIPQAAPSTSCSRSPPRQGAPLLPNCFSGSASPKMCSTRR